MARLIRTLSRAPRALEPVVGSGACPLGQDAVGASHRAPCRIAPTFGEAELKLPRGLLVAGWHDEGRLVLLERIGGLSIDRMLELPLLADLANYEYVVAMGDVNEGGSGLLRRVFLRKDRGEHDDSTRNEGRYRERSDRPRMAAPGELLLMRVAAVCDFSARLKSRLPGECTQVLYLELAQQAHFGFGWAWLLLRVAI